MGFKVKLEKRRNAINTCLCIRLDPDEKDIENFMKNEKENNYNNIKKNLKEKYINNVSIKKDILLKAPDNIIREEKSEEFFYFFNHFCFYIINETNKYALTFKMNFAFYIPYGSVGIDVLKNVFDYLYELNIPTILDMKINDIGNTVKNYRKFIFEYLKSDSCTVNIYMGTNMLKDICYDEEKNKYYSAFVLVKTTNPDSAIFQKNLSLDNKQAYVIMAQEALNMSSYLNLEQNNEFIGFVVGANSYDEMNYIRTYFPNCYILSPGIGAQNGDLHKTLTNGYHKSYEKILINIGRAITKNPYPQKAAQMYYDQINAILKQNMES